ncbi:MAG TPA: exopolysaccharide synthesis, exod [Parvularcula sp.]|nr:exopolysaccharide synthesis, exod [Parvularcula sp.]HBS31577.1 exopolysaccharide synthesis, exod [Parvularcula sp.]
MPSTIYEPLRQAIRKGDAEFVDAQEIVSALGPRAFGLSVMVVMAPVCLPMPPGVPTVAGVILGFLAIQMILGFKCPWIPKPMRRLQITRTKLLKAIDALERRLKFVERLAHPRLEFLTRGFGAQAVGIALLALAFVLILPIPFLGNLPPAIAAGILGLALAQRDGLMALFGFAATAGAIAFTWKLAIATVGLIRGYFS